MHTFNYALRATQLFCQHSCQPKEWHAYIGVTGDLPRRIVQHKEKQLKGFSSRYNIVRPVWWQDFDDVQLAIQREKTMKKWPRQWRINLIEEQNQQWEDLSHHLFNPSS